MTRLWLDHESDLTEHGHGANEEQKVYLYYGSSKKSILAASIRIVWLKGEEIPTVHLKRSNQIIVKEETFIDGTS